MTIKARWTICFANDLRCAGQALDGLMKELGLVRSDLASLGDRIPCRLFDLIERQACFWMTPNKARNCAIM
jgi:hypothetical protein